MVGERYKNSEAFHYQSGIFISMKAHIEVCGKYMKRQMRSIFVERIFRKVFDNDEPQQLVPEKCIQEMLIVAN